MPTSSHNLNAPKRGFYGRRISARQFRQLKKISADMSSEVHILRMKVYCLLDQIEGLTFYTDLDLSKLQMINTLVNTIRRLVRPNRLKDGDELELGALLEEILGEDVGPGIVP